jgi:heme/copper-type cytochrome/quinol oxidase subunit 1
MLLILLVIWDGKSDSVGGVKGREVYGKTGMVYAMVSIAVLGFIV